MKENDPTSVLLFLVGTKKDLSVSVSFSYCKVLYFFFICAKDCLPHCCVFLQSPAQYSLIEQDAIKVAQEMKAEYWAVSALSGKTLG